MVTRHSYVQTVPTRLPALTEELDRVEARMVGELARQVHEHGEMFTEWPTVERAWIAFCAGGGEKELAGPLRFAADHVRLYASVLAEPR